MSKVLILFYNTMWDATIDTRAKLPDGFEITADRRRYADASAAVFHIPSMKWTPRFLFPRKLPRQLWVAWSMESRENYARLRDESFMRNFDLTMTYRLNSDVPQLYFSYYSTVQELAHALRRPPQLKTADALAVMFISSRVDRSGRRAHARELMRYLRVDSYGKFLRNKTIPNDRGRPSKNEIIARYKFTLAFENSISEDYVTEKFFDPLVFGSVPVYLGAPNVARFAPGDHSFINVADFPSPRVLADYLNQLGRDETEYQTYFAWKEKPFLPAFSQMLVIQEKDSLAQLCERVRACLAARA
jgi:hypothetical protein